MQDLKSEALSCLGRGYDPVYLDRGRLDDIETFPVAHRTGVKINSPFVLEHDDKLHATVPKPHTLTGVTYLHRTEVATQQNEVSSSYEYSRKVSLSVKTKAGIDSLFTASRSVEWERLSQRIEKNDSTRVLTTGFRHLSNWILQLGNLNDPGTRVPELTDAFRTQLKAVAASQAAFEDFEGFVNLYGTHFAGGMKLGGWFEEGITITSSELTELESKGVKVGFEAELTLKKISAGVDIQSDLELSETWKQFYKKSDHKITAAGGKLTGGDPGTNLPGWLATVDDHPVVIEVSLIPLWELMAPSFFPTLGQQEIADARKLLQARTETYFETHGVNLGSSRIHDGDVVYISPLRPPSATPGPTNPSVETPEMLHQGPGERAQVRSANFGGTSLLEFKQECLLPGPSYQRHKPYLWTVKRVSSPGAAAEIKPGDRFRLVNVATGVPLDSQGANSLTGAVSAGTGVQALVDTQGNPSDVWTLRPLQRPRPGDDTAGFVMDSGLGSLLFRTYESPNPSRNIKGCLQVRSDGNAFSTGSPSLLSSADFIKNQCGLRIVKVNTPQARTGELNTMSNDQDAMSDDQDKPELRYEYLQAHIYLTNDTSFDLMEDKFELSWGKKMEGPHSIKPGGLDQLGFKSQGRANEPSGTRGWVSWRILGDTMLTVRFDCPITNKNTGEFKLEGPYEKLISVRQVGPTAHGNICHITLVLQGTGR